MSKSSTTGQSSKSNGKTSKPSSKSTGSTAVSSKKPSSSKPNEMTAEVKKLWEKRNKQLLKAQQEMQEDLAYDESHGKMDEEDRRILRGMESIDDDADEEDGDAEYQPDGSDVDEENPGKNINANDFDSYEGDEDGEEDTDEEEIGSQTTVSSSSTKPSRKSRARPAKTQAKSAIKALDAANDPEAAEEPAVDQSQNDENPLISEIVEDAKTSSNATEVENTEPNEASTEIQQETLESNGVDAAIDGASVEAGAGSPEGVEEQNVGVSDADTQASLPPLPEDDHLLQTSASGADAESTESKVPVEPDSSAETDAALLVTPQKASTVVVTPTKPTHKSASESKTGGNKLSDNSVKKTLSFPDSNVDASVSDSPSVENHPATTPNEHKDYFSMILEEIDSTVNENNGDVSAEAVAPTVTDASTSAVASAHTGEPAVAVATIGSPVDPEEAQEEQEALALAKEIMKSKSPETVTQAKAALLPSSKQSESNQTPTPTVLPNPPKVTPAVKPTAQRPVAEPQTQPQLPQAQKPAAGVVNPKPVANQVPAPTKPKAQQSTVSTSTAKPAAKPAAPAVAPPASKSKPQKPVVATPQPSGSKAAANVAIAVGAMSADEMMNLIEMGDATDSAPPTKQQPSNQKSAKQNIKQKVEKVQPLVDPKPVPPQKQQPSAQKGAKQQGVKRKAEEPEPVAEPDPEPEVQEPEPQENEEDDIDEMGDAAAAAKAKSAEDNVDEDNVDEDDVDPEYNPGSEDEEPAKSTKKKTKSNEDDEPELEYQFPNTQEVGSKFVFGKLKYTIAKVGRIQQTTKPEVASFPKEFWSMIQPERVFKAFRLLSSEQQKKHGGKNVQWDFFIVMRLVAPGVRNDPGKLKVHKMSIKQARVIYKNPENGRIDWNAVSECENIETTPNGDKLPLILPALWDSYQRQKQNKRQKSKSKDKGDEKKGKGTKRSTRSSTKDNQKDDEEEDEETEDEDPKTKKTAKKKQKTEESKAPEKASKAAANNKAAKGKKPGAATAEQPTPATHVEGASNAAAPAVAPSPLAGKHCSIPPNMVDNENVPTLMKRTYAAFEAIKNHANFSRFDEFFVGIDTNNPANCSIPIAEILKWPILETLPDFAAIIQKLSIPSAKAIFRFYNTLINQKQLAEQKQSQEKAEKLRKAQEAFALAQAQLAKAQEGGE